MERISWRDKIKNSEVLEIIGEERTLIEKIIRRKKNWIGHILRGDNLNRDVMEGAIMGRRRRGRRRIGMLDCLRKEDGYAGMKARAMDREGWKRE